MPDLSTLDQLGSVTTTEAAIIAAAQATEATAELLRFAREGAYSDAAPFDEEVVCKLAEALKLAIGIEGDPGDRSYLDPDEHELLGQLEAALARFVEGWAG